MRYSKRDGRKEWREKAKRSQEPKGRGELERWEGRGCFSWTFQSRITRVERVRHNKKSLAKKTEKKNISDSVSVWLVQRPVNKFPVHLLKTKGRPLYIHGHLLWSFGIASSVFPSLSALPPRDFRLGGANRKRKEDRISGLARERERERHKAGSFSFFPASECRVHHAATRVGRALESLDRRMEEDTPLLGHLGRSLSNLFTQCATPSPRVIVLSIDDITNGDGEYLLDGNKRGKTSCWTTTSFFFFSFYISSGSAAAKIMSSGDGIAFQH